MDEKKIKRFGPMILNVSIDWSILEKMNLDFYKTRLAEFQEKKICYLVREETWDESRLCYWFLENYKMLGFKEIILERTPRYKKIKQKMGFFGFPDFLVRRNSVWERLEVEVFSNSFRSHPEGYADFLFCYDETTPIKNVKTLTFRELMGYQEIINIMEIPQFLYLYDPQFKIDYNKIKMENLYRLFKRISE